MGNKQYKQEFYQRNKDRIQAKNRKWRESHKRECQCGALIDYRSTSCRSCASRIKGLKTASRRGENGINWKGGRYIHNGYVMIYKPEHPKAYRGKYVLEHVWVWEQYHQKFLPKGWTIHHLNGVKTDNRIINLIALTSRKHALVLAAKAKRIQELEALLNHQPQLL